jgi:hypothetical protein
VTGDGAVAGHLPGSDVVDWWSRGLHLLSAGRFSAGGGMDQETEVTLKIRVDRKKYAWSLYRNGISEPIKFSVPIFSTEADATAAGLQVLARINLRKKQFGMSKIPRSAP